MMHWLSHQWFSFALTAWGVMVFYKVGDQKRNAWALALLGQVAWFIYAWYLHQWGLFVGACFYSWVYLRNWLKWRKSRESVG